MKKKPKKIKSIDKKFLEWEETINLIEKLKSSDPKISLLIFLLIYTGISIGDALELQIKHVRNKNFLKMPFAKYAVDIKIHPALKHAIKEYLIIINTKNPEAKLFQGRTEDKHISIQWINKRLKQIAEEFNLSKKNISTFDFKIVFGRRVFENSVDKRNAILSLKKFFGHNSMNLTMEYLHVELPKNSVNPGIFDLL